jgi:outer membrane biosynthesis protein TonB
MFFFLNNKPLWLKSLFWIISYPITLPMFVWHKTKHFKFKKVARGAFIAIFVPVFLFSALLYASLGFAFTGHSSTQSVAGIQETKSKVNDTKKQEEAHANKIEDDRKATELKNEEARKIKEKTNKAKQELETKKLAEEKTRADEQLKKEAIEISRQKAEEEAAKQEIEKNNYTSPTSTNSNNAQNTVSTPSNQTPSNTGGYIPGNCPDLKAKGLGNFRPGDPNYTKSRDKNNDGVACEL